jgi:hypothetical protein
MILDINAVSLLHCDTFKKWDMIANKFYTKLKT